MRQSLHQQAVQYNPTMLHQSVRESMHAHRQDAMHEHQARREKPIARI